MGVLSVILIVLAVLIVVLGVGGYVAMSRRTHAREGKLVADLRHVERELAKARAADKGWDPATIEAVARAAAQERFGASGVKSLQLVQVIDRPGTDADQAVFRVQTADGEHAITLGRHDGVWQPA